jgi:hypothetical protein
MLNNPNPLTVDPVPAKVYDKLHVYTLNAIQPTNDSGSITVELLPATSSGELATGDKVQRISCPLYPAMDEVPELRAAFEAIISAIPAAQAWLAAQQENQETPGNQENPQAQE